MTLSADLSLRLADGGRLTDAEIGSLAGTHDIISLGMLADEARRRRHGNRTTFLRVAAIGVDEEVPASWPAGAGEIRIVGAPGTMKNAVARVAEIASRAAGLPLAGYSLADLEQLAGLEGLTLRALLESLREAGLELVSEAPFDLLQNPRRSIEEVNIAGLALSRLTIHKAPPVEIPTLLKRVADLQSQVAVVRGFAPLPRTFNPAAPSTGYEDIKRVALARLVVDGVPSIQVDWALYGPKLAQVALTVGADDVDNVSAYDDVSEGRRRAPLEEIRRNIQAASQEPVERNGRFEVVSR